MGKIDRLHCSREGGSRLAARLYPYPVRQAHCGACPGSTSSLRRSPVYGRGKMIRGYLIDAPLVLSLFDPDSDADPETAFPLFTDLTRRSQTCVASPIREASIPAQRACFFSLGGVLLPIACHLLQPHILVIMNIQQIRIPPLYRWVQQIDIRIKIDRQYRHFFEQQSFGITERG